MWKILIVDDSFVNRQLLLEILREKAQCDVAVNGKEAFEGYEAALEAGKMYDLILLDIAMPEVDGLDFLRLVRDQEKESGIGLESSVPIIMVTAHKSPFIVAFNQGCDDYILKPIDVDKLLEKIEKKLGPVK